jgi:hypothetical protein
MSFRHEFVTSVVHHRHKETSTLSRLISKSVLGDVQVTSKYGSEPLASFDCLYH